MSGTARAQHAPAPPLPASAPLVFDGVTVVDVETGRLLSGQRVVIAGNRIQAVGPRRAVPLPAQAQVVKATGQYLIPGLWDMHVHLRAETIGSRFPFYVAYGVTGIREGGTGVPIDTLVQWWREVLAGTRVGPPRQLQTGTRISEGGNDIPEAEVAALKAHGANFLKVYPYTPSAAAMARRVGLPFGGHVRAEGKPGATLLEASDSGLRIVDHLGRSAGGNDLDALCTRQWTGSDQELTNGSVEQCRPVAERFRRNGTWFVPTLMAVFLGNARSRAIAERVKARAEVFWADTTTRLNPFVPGYPAGDSASRAPATGLLPDSLGLLTIPRRVGLPLLAGTDVASWDWPAGISLHTELEMYVAEGLTPLEALQTATLNPARLLHGTDSLGTVAQGKLADLVLLDANPLVNIANTMTIRAVVANGRYYDRAALDRLLTEAKVGYVARGRNYVQ